MKKPRVPVSWIEKILSGLILRAQENLLADFHNFAIYDTPLIGIADGDDPLFHTFKKAVSPDHLLPREVMEAYADEKTDLSRISIISWALPFSDPVRRSNRGAGWPSRLYSAARNNGGALNYLAGLRFMKLLKNRGVAAVFPASTKEYDAFRSPDFTFSSTWSERHIAFAAGLGYFGLNASLITKAGASVRLGSIITNLDLNREKTPVRNHRAPCLDDKRTDCTACITRCPVNAITADGLDKEKCYAMRGSVRRRHLAQYAEEMNLIPSPIVKSGKRHEGYSLGCALCQCGVPCEGTDPFSESG